MRSSLPSRCSSIGHCPADRRLSRRRPGNVQVPIRAKRYLPAVVVRVGLVDLQQDALAARVCLVGVAGEIL
jgi:hypothetical protein